jgi:hypothetical protein
MPAAARPPHSSDWRDIARLGEQIVNADSLAEQSNHIIAMTSHLVKGEIDVWLCERVFRLPNLQQESVFPEEPELPGMRRAVKVGQLRTKRETRTPKPALCETWAAVLSSNRLAGALV